MSMLNFNTITEGVKSTLESSAFFSGWDMVVGEVVNEDPGIDNWLGIYRGTISYAPHGLGGVNARRWLASVDFKIIVQTFDVQGALAETDLEEKVQNVLETLETNRTLGGTVSMLNGYDVEYTYIAEDDATLFFQAAVIQVHAEVQT